MICEFNIEVPVGVQWSRIEFQTKLPKITIDNSRDVSFQVIWILVTPINRSISVVNQFCVHYLVCFYSLYLSLCLAHQIYISVEGKKSIYCWIFSWILSLHFEYVKQTWAISYFHIPWIPYIGTSYRVIVPMPLMAKQIKTLPFWSLCISFSFFAQYLEFIERYNNTNNNREKQFLTSIQTDIFFVGEHKWRVQ